MNGDGGGDDDDGDVCDVVGRMTATIKVCTSGAECGGGGGYVQNKKKKGMGNYDVAVFVASPPPPPLHSDKQPPCACVVITFPAVVLGNGSRSQREFHTQFPCGKTVADYSTGNFGDGVALIGRIGEWHCLWCAKGSGAREVVLRVCSA
jgi:hypothetical protein